MKPWEEGPEGYEAPALTVVGTVHELTLTGSNFPCVPMLNKTIGPPDFFNWIPISTCSP